MRVLTVPRGLTELSFALYELLEQTTQGKPAEDSGDRQLTRFPSRWGFVPSFLSKGVGGGLTLRRASFLRSRASNRPVEAVGSPFGL